MTKLTMAEPVTTGEPEKTMTDSPPGAPEEVATIDEVPGGATTISVSDDSHARSDEATVSTPTMATGVPTEPVVDSHVHGASNGEVPPQVPNAGMFAVQVAALGEESSIEKYTPLNQFGTVMTYPEGGYFKIRVGYFSTAAQARTALGKIRKHGYPDAFMVKATATNSGEVISASTVEKTAEKIAPATPYKVRLATYSKPGYFNAQTVEHLGEIESFRKNDLTVMLLAGYATFDSAERACQEAIDAGYPDAHVIVVVNGVMKRVGS